MKKVIFFLLLLIPFVIKAEVLKSEILFEGAFRFSDSFVGEDGRIYLSGYTSKGVVMILDSSYEEIKRKEFDEYDICMAVQLDEESNVYSLCKKRTYFQGFGITNTHNDNNYVELVKLDNNLNVIYQKSFQGPYDRSGPLTMLVKNGRIYFVTREYIYDSISREDDSYLYLNFLSNIYSYVTNLDGEVIKRTPLSSDSPVEFSFLKDNVTGSIGSGSVFGRVSNIIPIGDYLYICSAEQLTKTDYSGNIIWTKNLISDFKIGGAEIAKTNDGNIILGGVLYRNNPLETIDTSSAPILATFDINTGDLIDYEIYKGYGSINTIENKDGGYYVSFDLRGAVEGISDSSGTYFAKLDYNLNTKDVKKMAKTNLFYTGLAENGIYSYERWALVNYYSDFSGDVTAEKTIKMDETITIASILDVDLSSAEWAIDDPSIIKIEDGVITPKKIGSTYIRTTYENNDYSIKITVINLDKEESKEEEKENSVSKNPETYDFIIVLIGILIISFALVLSHYKKMLK